MTPNTWTRSSRCSSNGCVDVLHDGGTIRVRDSTHTAGPELAFDPVQWQAFIDAVKAGP